jgi:hypothetical protein
VPVLLKLPNAITQLVHRGAFRTRPEQVLWARLWMRALLRGSGNNPAEHAQPAEIF